MKDAATISRDLVANDKDNAHAHHTLVKVEIRALEESLTNGDSEELVAKRIKEAEDQLFTASQLFPGDSYLAESDVELAKLLNDHERARTSMIKAFDANPRNGLIALRLGRRNADFSAVLMGPGSEIFLHGVASDRKGNRASLAC